MPTKLTNEEMFDLGDAYGSISCGEYDQAIHILLPGDVIADKGVVFETPIPHNEVFSDLFEEYFDKIPQYKTKLSPEQKVAWKKATGNVFSWKDRSVSLAYMGAMGKWAKDHKIGGVPTDWIDAFHALT